MIIEFPKKYTVRMVHDGIFFVYVPAEHKVAVYELLAKQPWLKVYNDEVGALNCYISPAYDITPEQAHDALCRLCEHVMTPDVEVDREVWDLGV